MYRTFSLIAVAAIFTSFLVPANAQAPNFSGTWAFNEAESRLDPEAGLGTLGALGTPERLHISHADNGDLIIQSEWNTSEARLYRPGTNTIIPVGPDDRMKVRAYWNGLTLVAEGSRPRASGGSIILGIRRAISMTADGGSLTIQATTTSTRGDATSTMVYSRLDHLGPCEQWSEPCQER